MAKWVFSIIGFIDSGLKFKSNNFMRLFPALFLLIASLAVSADQPVKAGLASRSFLVAVDLSSEIRSKVRQTLKESVFEILKELPVGDFIAFMTIKTGRDLEIPLTKLTKASKKELEGKLSSLLSKVTEPIHEENIFDALIAKDHGSYAVLYAITSSEFEFSANDSVSGSGHELIIQIGLFQFNKNTKTILKKWNIKSRHIMESKELGYILKEIQP